jgi:transcriptional regulator with XRE-family HTH domain
MPSPMTAEPFAVEARRLMDERRITLRGLAAEAGVDKGYLSRALRGHEKASPDLIRRVTAALDLPKDYFPEARQAWMRDLIDDSPAAAATLYDAINRSQPLTEEELRRLREARKRGGKKPRSR